MTEYVNCEPGANRTRAVLRLSVLLACFLGMSLGCLAGNHSRNYLNATRHLLVLALAAGVLLSVNVVHLTFGMQLLVRNSLEQRLDGAPNTSTPSRSTRSLTPSAGAIIPMRTTTTADRSRAATFATNPER